MNETPSPSEPSHKTRNLLILGLAELLAMSLWFSASAVVPQLRTAWDLSNQQQSWMTLSVQIGFVVGALVSALLNLPDRLSLTRLIGISAILGAVLNACIAAFVDGPQSAIVLRFLTGACLAGTYPPGMKLVATWCKHDRGMWIGFLVGALAIGSASPHLLSALAVPDGGESGWWRQVLWGASAAATLGAFLMIWVRSGPYLAAAHKFHWRYAVEGFRDPAIRLANFGYFGHMWELYAMWTWVPLCLATSYASAGITEPRAKIAAFSVIAVGGIGSLIAGRLADRMGRTTITIWSLLLSGSCALLAGHFLASPGLLTLTCLVWGATVVADSAQFSTAVSELSDPRYVGTALTVQTSVGFLLTMITIRLVPEIVQRFGWEMAFSMLALGPVVGIISMKRLRGLPAAQKMASGNR